MIDKVSSYAGMRKAELRGKVFYLNNEPYYQRLVLDQGYYPDGQWTAPTDEQLRRDIELAKEAGFRRIGEKVVCHRARKYGSSKFGMERMVKGYLDLITVSFLSHFGRSPMYFFGGSPSSRSSTFRCFWSSSACSFSWPVSWAS